MVLDLHAVPGGQNGDWHSDNSTHQALFWRHRHFQDRTVWLWEQIARRYRDEPVVAGYNPLNEPADPTGRLLRPFCDRVVAAIREQGDEHIIFLDGDRYSQDFTMFADVQPNTVYAAHQYPAPGWYEGDLYPGVTGGMHWDYERVEAEFLHFTAFMREHGTPLWIGEFGPVYRGEPAQDAGREQLLRDQLDIYERHGAGWSLWTYKDLGVQGMLSVSRKSLWHQLVRPLLDQKHRLGADRWGALNGRMDPVIDEMERLMLEESPGYAPWPFGLRWMLIRTVRNIPISEMLLPRFAVLFKGADGQRLEELVSSFAFDACHPRREVDEALRSVLAGNASRGGLSPSQ